MTYCKHQKIDSVGAWDKFCFREKGHTNNHSYKTGYWFTMQAKETMTSRKNQEPKPPTNNDYKCFRCGNNVLYRSDHKEDCLYYPGNWSPESDAYLGDAPSPKAFYVNPPDLKNANPN